MCFVVMKHNRDSLLRKNFFQGFKFPLAGAHQFERVHEVNVITNLTTRAARHLFKLFVLKNLVFRFSFLLFFCLEIFFLTFIRCSPSFVTRSEKFFSARCPRLKSFKISFSKIFFALT